jgi:hypothetical protein
MVIGLNAMLPCMLDLVRVHTRRDNVPCMFDRLRILRVCNCEATWGYLRQLEILKMRPTYSKASKNPYVQALFGEDGPTNANMDPYAPMGP